MITLTLIAVQLLLLAIDEVWRRGISSQRIQNIGNQLFGTYYISLIIYEAITLGWLISGFYDIYGPSLAPREDMLIYTLFAAFVIALIWMWQYSRFQESNEI
ncbi:MAG: hypothetical protein ACFFAX_01645 [Promethearchaeota archaeon]